MTTEAQLKALQGCYRATIDGSMQDGDGEPVLPDAIDALATEVLAARLRIVELEAEATEGTR